MPDILPTVGRIVYYKVQMSQDANQPAIDRAAIITEVIDQNSGIVTLSVFNPTGVFLAVKVGQGQHPGEWDWMPFQKDQQARLAKETK